MKSRPKASTFRARLWRSFALLALAVLAMLWLLQTVFMQAFYDQAVKEGVRDAAAQAQQAWVSEAPATFEGTLDAIASDKSLLVIVATWDEEVLYGTDEHSAAYTQQPEGGVASGSSDAERSSWESSHGQQDPGQYGWQVGRARNVGLTDGFGLFLGRLAADPGSAVEYQDDDGSLYTYGIALPEGGDAGSAAQVAGAPAVLYASTTLQPVGAAATAIRTQLALATAVSLALAFILAFALARGFAKPVEGLTRKARRLSGRAGGETGGEPDFEAGFCSELDELDRAIDESAAELARADELRAEFMANVSHDLRTPLTLIRGYAEATLDDLEEGGTVESRDLKVIAQEAERLGILAGELLDYSKLRDGGVLMDMAEFDTSGAFAKAAELFAPLCERAGTTLETDIESGLRAVGDEAQLTRVVSNLLDNAVSHTPSGGAVTVSLREEAGSLRFEVRDGGPGIPPDEVDRVWERYFTKKQAGRNAKGSGLGLAISREILDAHGAAYGAENLPEGGSVFWFAIGSANTGGNA